MHLKKSSMEEQKKDFKRNFSEPQFYVCEVVNKKDESLIGILPFAAFSKVDTMVIINSLATQVKIESKDLNFVSLENSNILVSAVGENDEIRLKVSIQDLEEIQRQEKEALKGEKDDEESEPVQEGKE